MKNSVRAALFFVCIGVSVAMVVNALGDNADVIAQATKVACNTPAPCSRSHDERTPFAQTFVFATKTSPIVVRCARALVFVGDYACEREPTR